MLKRTIISLLILTLGACSASLVPPLKPDLKSIPLELTTHRGEQQTFFEDDEIQFLLSLGSDAYIYMYYIDATDNLMQILPNKRQLDNYYSSGYFLTIPEYEEHYRFTVNKPFGDTEIWIFASDRSIDMNNTGVSLDHVKQKIKQASEQAYGEYVLKLTTREK